MHDMTVFAEKHVAAKEAHRLTSEERDTAKKELRLAKATFARANGLKLPSAGQAELEMQAAKWRDSKAKKGHEQAVLALSYAAKAETDARKDNEEEALTQAALDAYNVTIGPDWEKLGIAYDDSDRSVFIDFLEDGEVTGSMHTSHLEDIELIITTLTAMAKKMH